MHAILKGVECHVVGPKEKLVNRITFDSRKAQVGDLFAAIKGTTNDGHQYIPQVVSKGVSCVLCEEPPEQPEENVSYIIVEDSQVALGKIASNFYQNPSSKFKLVGITGTNGKTSVVTLLHKLFTLLGYKVGLLSTVKNLIGEKVIEATHTTPDSVSLNKLMYDMVAEGCDYVFMEVSSHSIDQNRISGLSFDGGVFTNITHDHLDYHKTFAAYIKAKKLFFDTLPETAFALVNQDDKHSGVMIQNTKARKLTYSLNHFSDFKGKVLESHFEGTLIHINNKELWIKLIGLFNSSNLMAVYGVATLLNQEEEEVLKYLSALETVDGRFEFIRSNSGVTAVVDYAHTPDALKNVIGAINKIREGSGKLITVVGAGGNRDKSKRPVMGKVAADGSEKVIFTSDNPRDEEPSEIIKEMLDGVDIHLRRNALSITDRREAIRTACMLAVPGDVILVAGKGHEDYQEIKGVKNHFSDKEIVAENLMLNQINQQ